MFSKYILDKDIAEFIALSNTVEFETFSGARKGAILFEHADGSIPIVRTTTTHSRDGQVFSSAHHDVIKSVKKASGMNQLRFNNAMIEIYDPAYTKMGFHSDQALDLAADSYICIVSCYEDELEENPRRLIVKSKLTHEVTEITMENGSCILFSTSTNDEYLHKIVTGSGGTQSRWLGLTLRLSDTYIYAQDNRRYFVSDNNELTFSDEEQRHEFFRHKSLQNAQVGYVYPKIRYTLSKH